MRLNRLDGSAAGLPVQPAAGVLADSLPTGLSGQGGGRASANTGLAVEDEGGGGCRSGDAVHAGKLVLGQTEALANGGEGDVDGARDLARGL